MPGWPFRKNVTSCPMARIALKASFRETCMMVP
jgi:hypothetical protein